MARSLPVSGDPAQWMQGTGDDEARVDAAGPIGGQAADAAAKQALDGGGRDGGEQADALDAAFAQHLRLARADAVQPVDRQRGEPVGDLVRGNGEHTARRVGLGGGGGHDRDGRPDPDPDVNPEPGQRPHPKDRPGGGCQRRGKAGRP
ncbi:hypothetical protein [Streptomyces coeruleorubidus]|uniref:hypothetical protein n=1 Tax=Streptomyces coeruleorubidus TaxID=116188 RepID=UPI00364C9417